MSFKTSRTLVVLATLAASALAEPVILEKPPGRVGCVVGAIPDVTVKARGNGVLAYQWHKGPFAESRRADLSPFRLNGQQEASLLLECAEHLQGEYWVQVTDLADFKSVIAGPVCLVPCYPLDRSGIRRNGLGQRFDVFGNRVDAKGALVELKDAHPDGRGMDDLTLVPVEHVLKCAWVGLQSGMTDLSGNMRWPGPPAPQAGQEKRSGGAPDVRSRSGHGWPEGWSASEWAAIDEITRADDWDGMPGLEEPACNPQRPPLPESPGAPGIYPQDRHAEQRLGHQPSSTVR